MIKVDAVTLNVQDIYPEDYNEGTEEFFGNMHDWERGFNRHKNYCNFMKDLHKIGVGYFYYVSDYSSWVRLYVMYENSTNKSLNIRES